MASITFMPIIMYTGKGRPHREFGEIIDGFCGVPWSRSRSQIRVGIGETMHDALARGVRLDFTKAAKLSGSKLDPKPFRITVEID